MNNDMSPSLSFHPTTFDTSQYKPARDCTHQDLELLWQAGVYYQTIELHDLAIEYFERILTLNPQQPDSFSLSQVRERCASMYFAKEESLHRSKQFSRFFSSSRQKGNEHLKRLAPGSFALLRSTELKVTDFVTSGQFGRVHLGQIKKNKAYDVVVKCLITNPEINEQSVGWHGFVHELVMHARLSHATPDYFVLLLAACTNPLCPSLVFERMNLGSLDVCLNTKSITLDASQKQLIKENIVCAMNYLHGNNIVHQDLRIEHVLLNQSNDQLEVKLSGLGHAYLVSETTTIPPSLRTFWHAPEIKRGDICTKASDVYALALLLGIIESDQNTGISTLLESATSPMLLRSWNENPLMRPSVNEIQSYISEDELVTISLM